MKYEDRSATLNAGQTNVSDEEKKFFKDNNNFIDYFLEIGVKPDIFSAETITANSSIYDINSQLSPEIISKFPYFDKKSMGIDDSIISFVFPHGFKSEIRGTKPDPIFYSLILDNQLYSSVYSYKYVACLVIYESLYSYKKAYNLYSGKNISQTEINTEQFKFKNIFVPKCLCLASVHPAINKLECILRAIYSFIVKGKKYFLDIIIEKLVSQVPKIPRGLKRIYLKINEQNIIDLTERKTNELMTIDIDLKELFFTFKIDKIVDIFKFLLYETKTIFFGSNLDQVTKTILSFLILLRPFTYQYQILSVLPKEYYLLLETDNPWIFGINETYTKNFFEENKLEVDQRIMLIVDLDKKDYSLILAGGNVSSKQFPAIPKHLKEKLDKRTEEYKKNKKLDVTNEGFQEIFFRFMVNLLKDYPKFLKTYNVKSKDIKDMIAKQEYINSQSNSDIRFYEQITKSQMFDELIKKRMMPKDLREKIQALFFEEKLNEKYAQKKFFRGNKILEQNTLIPSKEYDYVEPKEMIDISETGLCSKLDANTVNFFSRENVNKEDCLPRGFSVRPGSSKGEFFFEYYMFPALLSEKLFKYNCKNYIVPTMVYSKKIEELNRSIIRNCFIKFDDIKKNTSNELLNDVYISYLILFSLTFWYTDSDERQYRFNNMMLILEKIEAYDLEVMELLFNTMIKLGEEEFAILLYTQYLNLHLNPTSKIFSVVSKILKKQQGLYPESTSKSLKSNRSASLHCGNRSMVYTPQVISDTNNFRTRTLKLPGIDKDILGEQVQFDAYGICLDCKGVVNLEKICTELTNKEIDKENRFKCSCKSNNNWCMQKINFRIGTELYNTTISLNNSSSKNQGIMLFNPSTLKKNLLEIAKIHHDTYFEVEEFRIKYPNEFWNALWYFELKNIDVSFMMPYIKPNIIKMKTDNENKNHAFKFVYLDSKFKNKEYCPSVSNFKNPNNIKQIVRGKEKIFDNKYLYKQNACQFAIINILGMIMYKTSDEFNENIGFNEKLLCAIIHRDKDKDSKNKKPEEKTDKIKKSNFNLNSNIVTSEIGLSNSIIEATTRNDKENDIKDEVKPNPNPNNNSNNDNNNDIKKTSSKVHFDDTQLFEMMNEDDPDYYILDDYKEVDSSEDND